MSLVQQFLGYILLTGYLTTYILADEKCIDYTKYIHHHHKTEAYRSFDQPRGVWASTRCEITRGGGKSVMHAKFIYRRFMFENGKWSGHIYHYSDSWCTKPSFTITFEGDYTISRLNSSSAYTVSSPAKFTFTKIKYISSQEKNIETFLDFMMTKCPNAMPAYSSNLQEGSKIVFSNMVNKDIDIDDYVLKKKHCRYFLGLHPYSYQKLRLVHDSTRGAKYSTLYFGDIPQFTTSKMHSYKPPSFQYGLARVDRPWCKVCKLAEKSNTAPILPAPTQQNNLEGDWVTDVCTAADESTYNTMQFSFGDGKFSLYHVIFVDQNCRRRQYAYQVGGTYTGRETGDKIDGIVGVSMTSTWMKLTIFDRSLLDLVQNSKNCGKSKEWVSGVEQDVTGTKGCVDLFQQQLPMYESYIARAATFGSKRELYISEYDTGIDFNMNLVTCDSATQNIVVKRTTLAPPTTVAMVSIPKDDKKIINEHIEKTLRKEMEKQNSRKPSKATNLRVTFTAIFLSIFFTTYLFLV